MLDLTAHYNEYTKAVGLAQRHLQTMSKYLFVKYLLISKQTGTQVELFKKLIFGGSIWGGGTPKLCQNICRLNIY